MQSAKQQPSNVKHGGAIRPNVWVLTFGPPCMCVELIDNLRLKVAVISGSIIKGIVVGIIEAKFSNLMEKEDVNYDNARQVLHHYQTKKPRFICKIGKKTS